jgi:glycosyltransferase involved in cell wall biosynthesis
MPLSDPEPWNVSAKQSSAPCVSVVIPTHNRVELLLAAVASVQGQSFRDVEILVCDDGSTDGTAARLKELGGAVRHLRLPHTGSPGAARNAGLAAARGELIAFLDDDDLWEPDKLERQVECFDRDPALGLVYTDARLLYPDGTLSAPVLQPFQHHPRSLFDLLLSGWQLLTPTVVVRRALIDRVGPFDPALITGEDYDLWLRVARRAPCACVPLPLVRIRRGIPPVPPRDAGLSYQNAIAVLERQRAGLGLRRRLRARVTLSHLHRGLAGVLLQRGDWRGARRHALHALGYEPYRRSAWMVLLHSFGQERAD